MCTEMKNASVAPNDMSNDTRNSTANDVLKEAQKVDENKFC